MAGRRAPSGASRLGPRCWAPPRHPRAVSLASRRDRGAAGWHSCHGPPVAGNRPPVLAAPSKRCNGRLASTGLLPACSHQKEDSTHSPAPNEPRGLVKRSTRCVGRESNPGQLLGRQLCSPLYHQRHPAKTAAPAGPAAEQGTDGAAVSRPGPRRPQGPLTSAGPAYARGREPSSTPTRSRALRLWPQSSGRGGRQGCPGRGEGGRGRGTAWWARQARRDILRPAGERGRRGPSGPRIG